MATKLNKKVRRETDALQRYGKHRGKNLIVILEPPTFITVRIKGTREEYTTDIETVFRDAMKRSLIKRYEDKLNEYKIKKKAGYKRIRKPIKPHMV